MQNTLIAGISAAAMAAGLGLGVTQLATADTTTTPTPTASASVGEDSFAAVGSREGMGHHGGRGMLGADAATLAEKLGVEEDALEEAMDVAREGLESVEPSEDATDEERELARTERRAAFVSAVAGELGIDESTVRDALDEIRAARAAERAAADSAILDQAVTDGTLTQADADAVRKAIDAGIVSTRGGGHRGR